DAGIGPQRRQHFIGVIRIGERQRGGAVGGDHLRERRELALGGLPEGEILVRQERRAGDEQDQPGRRENKSRQAPADRNALRILRHSRLVVTMSAGRSSFELSLRPADSATSRLTRRRMRLWSLTSATIPPRWAKSSASPTVRTW